MNIQTIKALVLNELSKLPSDFTYHGRHHTEDVCTIAQNLCIAEKCTAHETLLVATAALLHDIGFRDSYRNHEHFSIRYARVNLPLWGFSAADIERIGNMIWATKIPQNPKNDTLAAILCDADLDYLGRDDFEPIAHSLFEELKERNMVQNEDEWNKIQRDFIEKHQYFTATNRALREPLKQKNLNALRQKMLATAI